MLSPIPLLASSAPLLPHISFSSAKPQLFSANPATAEIISEAAKLFLKFQSKPLKDMNEFCGSGTCTSLFAVQMILPLFSLSHLVWKLELQMLGGRW